MATRERTASDQHENAPYEISLVRRDDDDGPAWTAQLVEFPGCEARGDTEAEALAGVRLEMARWIDDALANDRPIPSPRAANAYSGRLLVRMPPTLHADLARTADREKVSLNTLIVGILGGALAWRQAEASGDVQAGGGDLPPLAPSPERAETLRRRLSALALPVGVGAAVLAAAIALALLVVVLTS